MTSGKCGKKCNPMETTVHKSAKLLAGESLITLTYEIQRKVDRINEKLYQNYKIKGLHCPIGVIKTEGNELNAITL